MQCLLSELRYQY